MVNVSRTWQNVHKIRHISNNLDIGLLFLKNYACSFSGRQIARECQLSPQAALNKANALVEYNFLMFALAGRNKMYSLNPTEHTKMYIEIAELSSSLALLKSNKELSVIIPEIIPYTDSLILFGSFSSGLQDKKSDVDLVAVGKADKPAIERITQKYNRQINIEYLDWSSLKHAFKNKMPLSKEIQANHKFFGNTAGLVNILWGVCFG